MPKEFPKGSLKTVGGRYHISSPNFRKDYKWYIGGKYTAKQGGLYGTDPTY